MKLPVKQKTQFSLIYLLIGVVVLSVVQSWLLAPRIVEIPMSKFLALVREGKVERVSVTDREIRGTLKSGAGTAEVSNGKLRGDEITFSAGGSEYTGRVNGNTMQGSVKGAMSGAWRATKALP